MSGAESPEMHMTEPPTVNVLDHVDAEPMPGDGHQDFPSALPPGQVVGRAPRGYCTEQKLEVVLLRQLLRWGHEAAEFH